MTRDRGDGPDRALGHGCRCYQRPSTFQERRDPRSGRPHRREPVEQRLAAIQGAILELIATHAPAAVVLESLFIGANPRTIMSVCQARGAALAVCGAHGIACTEYAPSQVKTAVCGNGAAGKDQVMRMIKQLLSLPAPPESDHAADALALALCHAWSARAGERFARARAAR